MQTCVLVVAGLSVNVDVTPRVNQQITHGNRPLGSGTVGVYQTCMKVGRHARIALLCASRGWPIVDRREVRATSGHCLRTNGMMSRMERTRTRPTAAVVAEAVTTRIGQDRCRRSIALCSVVARRGSQHACHRRMYLCIEAG